MPCRDAACPASTRQTPVARPPPAATSKVSSDVAQCLTGGRIVPGEIPPGLGDSVDPPEDTAFHNRLTCGGPRMLHTFETHRVTGEGERRSFTDAGGGRHPGLHGLTHWEFILVRGATWGVRLNLSPKA